MKRRFLLLATLFMMVSFMTNAQDYWIEGFYERHGAGNYTLKDVNTNGIKIDGRTRLSETLRGNKMHITCDNVDATMIQFAFENADLKCDNPDITFQYWSEDINDWKTDVEACKYEAAGYSQKDMVMMLVLDYSNSMSTNRGRMQDMAYTFIKNASNYSNGNIHIGIVAFSGMDITKVMEITPLRRENLSKFERFIKTEAQPGMETALYYAFDVAMKEIENYVAINNFNKENYNGSCMITFTDGLDNASINDQISNRMQRGSKNEYLAYLSDKVQKGPQQKRVLGLPVESYAVGFTGSEHFTTDDLTLFRLVLQKLTTDDDHFTLSDDFAVVERFFNTIFEQLTSRWKTLNLYIGEAQYGKVRWLLNCPEHEVKAPKPLPPVKPKSNIRFNLNLGLTTMNVKETYYGQTDKYSLTGEKDASTKGVYLGVSWDMSFKYGLGIEFADLGFAYYRGSKNESYYGESMSIKATSLNVYLSPIKLQYRYETPSSFAVFAATGPALDFCLDYTVKYDYYDSYYGYGESDSESDIYKSLYFYWDIKGGVAYKFMKLTLGTSLRMNNVAKTTNGDIIYPSDYTAKVGRPFYLMFSFVF